MKLVRFRRTGVGQGRITPRHFVLRVFHRRDVSRLLDHHARRFCRIADQPDALAVSMGRRPAGGRLRWFPDKAVSTANVAPTGEAWRIRRIAGWVPSRAAADNLFWLGRYLERREATLRLFAGARYAARTRKGRQPCFTRLSNSTRSRE